MLDTRDDHNIFLEALNLVQEVYFHFKLGKLSLDQSLLVNKW